MGYVQLLPFDTDEPEFVRGMEIGRLWERLKYENNEVVAVIHTTNAEMVIRISEAIERPVKSEELGDGWMEIIFEAKEAHGE